MYTLILLLLSMRMCVSFFVLAGSGCGSRIYILYTRVSLINPPYGLQGLQLFRRTLKYVCLHGIDAEDPSLGRCACLAP